jgi:hypothetical protein
LLQLLLLLCRTTWGLFQSEEVCEARGAHLGFALVLLSALQMDV